MEIQSRIPRDSADDVRHRKQRYRERCLPAVFRVIALSIECDVSSPGIHAHEVQTVSSRLPSPWIGHSGRDLTGLADARSRGPTPSTLFHWSALPYSSSFACRKSGRESGSLVYGVESSSGLRLPSFINSFQGLRHADRGQVGKGRQAVINFRSIRLSLEISRKFLRFGSMESERSS